MTSVRPALFILLLVAACYHDSKPAPVANAAPPPAAQAWQTQSAAFMGHFADALDAAHDDCPALVTELQKLAPEAKELAGTLKASGHKFNEHQPEAGLEARFAKHDGFMDRCEKEQTPGFGEAVDATLLTVAPFEPDMKGVDLGGAFAPK